MPSPRQIRQRIRSIQSTKQIMRAMQLVSGSKLKRTQGKLFQGRAVMDFLDGLLQRVLASLEAENTQSKKKAADKLTHPLCVVKNPQAPSALVFVTSDTGLCGSYNTNLIHQAEAYLRRDAARQTKLVFIGKKGHRHFTKRGYAALESHLDLAGRPNPAKTEAIAKGLIARFLTGEIASVHLLFSQFQSATVYKPVLWQWLPIQLEKQADAKAQAAQEYIFEPTPKRVFEDLLPRWAIAKFQLAILEAFTSEHSARMIAMKNATDNAEGLLKALTLQRNRIRQASITKEISEIVGTAEALK